jgi:murein DD-endopeptidase MepM/ murein hydrolase activator NlpD
VSPAEIGKLAKMRALQLLRPGMLVRAEVTSAGSLRTLRYLSGRESMMQVVADGDAYRAAEYPAPLESRISMRSGVIRSSLFAATDAAGIPDPVAIQLAEMFSSSIDFRRDLRQGDRFNVVYESLEADGESLRTGRVLSAEFANDGQQHQAVWFEEAGHKGGYYSFDGQSSRRYYLASPLEFSRVSSGYGMRFHPITGGRKAHMGVDYAAPTGTPVRTIGDGTVEFAGVQRGYGNVIYVKHRNNQVTVYAHLSRIGVRKGQRVSQGDFIGAVGTTGASTGPHLHLEFRDNGVHVDPLAIARQSESIPVPAALRQRFEAVAQLQRMQLNAAASIQQANAQ